MKKFLSSFLTLAVLMLGSTSFAIFTNDPTGQALLTRMNNMAPHEGSGTVLNRTKNMMKVVYDFSVLGGATGALLLDEQGNPAVLPKGAFVTNVVAVVQTGVTAAGAATVALTDLTSGDLMAATAKASLTAAAIVAGVPVGTAATWVGPVTASAGTQLQVTIASGPLTAGKIFWFVEYVIQ